MIPLIEMFQGTSHWSRRGDEPFLVRNFCDTLIRSGSTCVAAARTGRGYIGYDLDGSYVDLARTRLERESAP